MRSSRPISNISALLLLSILYALWPGSMGTNWLPHASLLSNGFTLQLKKVSQQCQKWF